jgi:hypothetical protein
MASAWNAVKKYRPGAWKFGRFHGIVLNAKLTLRNLAHKHFQILGGVNSGRTQ